MLSIVAEFNIVSVALDDVSDDVSVESDDLTVVEFPVAVHSLPLLSPK